MNSHIPKITKHAESLKREGSVFDRLYTKAIIKEEQRKEADVIQKSSKSRNISNKKSNKSKTFRSFRESTSALANNNRPVLGHTINSHQSPSLFESLK